MPRRMIVIGAGPIGLEAALGAIERGFDVTVLEKGRIGETVRRYGSTRFFSPLSMNVSPRAMRALGRDAPPSDALLTAEEHVERVLVPLAERAPLAGRVMTGHQVIDVGRARLGRMSLGGHPIRAERPFRVIAETAGGDEVAFEAERVLDASGVYDQPQRLGAGGLLAPGERDLGDRVIRHLGDLEAKRSGLAGKTVLLVGHGHSAANAIALLADLARGSPNTRIVWAVRTRNQRPIIEVPADPLPERREVVARANALAEDPPPFLSIERGAHIDAVAERSVILGPGRVIPVDVIVSLTGYRPDHSFLGELELEISPVNEGVRGIHQALANVTDCLAVPKLSERDLFSGEPGFHLIGVKSYGRLPTFLLQNGILQLESILNAL